MKRATGIKSGALWAVIFFTAIFVALPATAQARSVAALEGAGFNVSSSMSDNLKAYTGKDVVIHLRSGKSFQGYVKSVGNHVLHLEKLAGRDFYDALIRIDDISAIEARFREMKQAEEQLRIRPYAHKGVEAMLQPLYE